MAISIDWGTKIISVPKADMLLVQATPFEVRELDLDWFRLQLKDLEDSEEGMSFPDTHLHNTTVTVGGVTLAHVIQIINGYTVTFENGTYAVNLVGANSNIGDNVNVNNVSVRSANSAGLTYSEQINDQSFINGLVYIDTVNGRSGTQFPRGTLTDPVDNLPDAITIADNRNIHGLNIYGLVTLCCDLTGWYVRGTSMYSGAINFNGHDISNTAFERLTCMGNMDGSNAQWSECLLDGLTGVSGTAFQCGIQNGLGMNGAGAVFFGKECAFIDELLEVDVGGANRVFKTSGEGSIKLLNMATGVPMPSIVQIGLTAGAVEVDSSCTGGYLVVEGPIQFTNNGTGLIAIDRTLGGLHGTGSWEGNLPADIATSVWSAATRELTAGPVDDEVLTIRKLTSNKVTKTGNIITIYEDNNIDVWRQYDLSSGGRVKL